MQHAHLCHAKDRGHRILRMQRRKERMPRKCDAHGHLRRLPVSYLAEQNLLRILPERRTQPRHERQSGFGVHLNLADPVDAPFHRILERHDVAARIAERRERGIERRRLARIHRPAEEQQPRRPPNQTFKQREIFGGKPELRTAEKPLGGIHDAHDHAFPVDHREHRGAHIDQTPAVCVAELAVLRTIALGDIDPRHHLESRNDHRRQLRRQLHGPLSEEAVHAQTNAQPAVQRLEVNIRRLLRKRRIENRIDERHHMTVARALGERSAPYFTHRLRHQPLRRLPLHSRPLLSLRRIPRIIHAEQIKSARRCRRTRAKISAKRSGEMRPNPT